MKLIVHQIPVLMDNYAYVIQCSETGEAALIDTPDADAIQAFLDREGITPNYIWNTHHHWDHAGGNLAIQERYGCQIICSHYDSDRIEGASKTVGEGDFLLLGKINFKVIDVPGHTLGHIAYYTPGYLFCGDTLFVGGCGRLFEGTPEIMWSSIEKILSLPDSTQMFCAHEYTQSNLRFANSLEPHNKNLVSRIEWAESLRANKQSTVCTTLGEEKMFNPFLRVDSPEILESLRKNGYRDLKRADQVFGAIRELKDQF